MKTKSHPRKRAFGPGTIASLVGIAVFAAYGYHSKSGTPKSIYFEADASGRLKQLERPSAEKTTPPPLWKPEPQLLQRHRLILKLTRLQEVQIGALASQWGSKKADLLRRIEAESTGVRSDKTSMVALQSSMGGYSELSRLYDQTRRFYWTSAEAALDTRQRVLVRQIEKGEVRL